MNQTWYGVSQGYIESRRKSVFCIACLGKKLGLHTELFEFLEKGIFKMGLFYRVKELSELNQTWYGVFQGYIESRRKRIFCIARLGKKFLFRTEICFYFANNFE